MSRIYPRFAVGALWLVALSVVSFGQTTLHQLNPSSVSYTPVAPSGVNWYWFIKIRPANGALPAGGTLIATSSAANNYNPGGTKNFGVPAQTYPFELIVGRAMTSNGTDMNWVSEQSWFSTPQGATPGTHAYFPPNTGTGFDYVGGTGRTDQSGNAVSGSGTVSAPPGPSTQEVGQKVGVSLANNTGQPQDYIVRPRDANGNAIPGMPDEVVSLAPGQTWGKQYQRPSTSGSGAFTVGVGRMDWVPDAEFGGVTKQEVPLSNHPSLPVQGPVSNPTPPPTQSTGGITGNTNTPAPAPAANTQVSGSGAATASQSNTMTNNIVNELQRLGAIGTAAANAAHTDSLAILGAIAAQADSGAGAEVDMSGVISAVNQGTQATEGVGDQIGEIKGILEGEGPGTGPGDNPEDDGSFLQGLTDMLNLAAARATALNAMYDQTFDTIMPGSSNRESLDFSLSTQFGSVNFNFSQYDNIISLVRDVILWVTAFNLLCNAVGMVRGAFVDESK